LPFLGIVPLFFADLGFGNDDLLEKTCHHFLTLQGPGGRLKVGMRETFDRSPVGNIETSKVKKGVCGMDATA